MNRNVEIKAKVADLEAVSRRAESLADEGPTILEQEDTFFACAKGRLKLRRFGDGREAELISYERPDSAQPKASDYLIYRSANPDALMKALAVVHSVRGVVRKQRTLYMVGRTRIHLDEVEGLGSFVELEVVLRTDESQADGVAVAEDLMGKLAISHGDLVTGAYIDLLEAM